MGKLIFLLIFLLVPWRAMPQDERYFRQIFSGEISKAAEKASDKKYSYFLHTPYYGIDLNNDKILEQIVFVKKDSEDWIEIFEEKSGIKNKVFSYRFETKGFGSELFRIEFKRLSAETTILLLHYYEGTSRYTEMQSSSKIYALTIDRQDLNTISALSGPTVFEEYKSLKGNYHLRNYQVYLEDLNNDLSKELVIKYRSSIQVFMYLGNGKWKSFNH
jgi:hypothetical protein